MFGGRETMVRLLFPMELINNAVDRFGSGAMLVPQGSHLFTLSAEVAVSPVFFSWVFSFGGRVKILGPEPVQEEYRAMCRRALDDHL